MRFRHTLATFIMASLFLPSCSFNNGMTKEAVYNYVKEVTPKKTPPDDMFYVYILCFDKNENDLYDFGYSLNSKGVIGENISFSLDKKNDDLQMGLVEEYGLEYVRLNELYSSISYHYNFYENSEGGYSSYLSSVDRALIDVKTKGGLTVPEFYSSVNYYEYESKNKESYLFLEDSSKLCYSVSSW